MKPKCPKCKKKKHVVESHPHDCPYCTCDKEYTCNKCWVDFNEKGEEI